MYVSNNKNGIVMLSTFYRKTRKSQNKCRDAIYIVELDNNMKVHCLYACICVLHTTLVYFYAAI